MHVDTCVHTVCFVHMYLYAEREREVQRYGGWHAVCLGASSQEDTAVTCPLKRIGAGILKYLGRGKGKRRPPKVYLFNT